MADNGQFGTKPTPAAGWYEDPSNVSGLRYWSGTAWTEHVAPAPAPAPAPARAAESWTPSSASGQSPSHDGAVAPGYQPATPGYPAATPSYQAAPTAPWAQPQGRTPGWDLDAAPLGFGEAIKSAFRNFVTFRGRASRSAYWWFSLFVWLVDLPFFIWYFATLMATVTQIATTSGVNGTVTPAFPTEALLPAGLLGLVGLVFFLPALAVAIRRLHDCDRSGWFYLVSFIPIIGGIVLLVFFVQEGNPGPNQYSLPSPVGGNPSQATWQ